MSTNVPAAELRKAYRLILSLSIDLVSLLPRNAVNTELENLFIETQKRIHDSMVIRWKHLHERSPAATFEFELDLNGDNDPKAASTMVTEWLPATGVTPFNVVNLEALDENKMNVSSIVNADLIEKVKGWLLQSGLTIEESLSNGNKKWTINVRLNGEFKSEGRTDDWMKKFN